MGQYQVIGGGVVGLAIARQLAARNGTSTVLIERNSAVGMETSSRNSEVYLPPRSSTPILSSH
jgi:2-hydroxyglutarate dehydrogenase